MDKRPPSLYRLSPRTVLRLRGADRERYLNGQVTQDVRLAVGNNAVFACVLNAKGKIDAVCHIREHEDSYLIDAPLELREDLFARLDRYIIADDVELTDESDDWHVAHLASEHDLPEGIESWKCTRLGEPGIDLLSRNPISLEGVRPLSAEALEILRTGLGLPNWGSEITPGTLPPDLLLQEESISYDKGCYIGQEVISRMKVAGKTNRTLLQFFVMGDCRPPCLLFADGKEAGSLTSVTRDQVTLEHYDADTSVRALGFLKRKFVPTDCEDPPRFELRSSEGESLGREALLDLDSRGLRKS